MRTPNQYGYITYSLTPGTRFNASLSGVYTGPMDLVHYAGAPEQTVDDYVTAPSFFELGIKAGYTFRFEVLDSGYIYGPGAPRTYYLGLRLHSF